MSMLKDAILDAKQVKQLAMANAKAAIEETFKPTVTRLVSAKLAEEEGEEDEDLDIDLNFGADESAPEGEEGGDVGFDSFDDSEAPAPEGEEDLELESLLRELEGEEDEMEFTEGDEEEFDVMEGEEDEMEFTEGDEEMSDDDAVYEAILRELEGGDEELTESDDDGGVFTERPPTSQMNTENRKLRRELAKAKSQLREALMVTATQKRTLNEVNLLNAKLMYNVKVSRQYDLTTKQKTTVLESLDRANTVREVKLVYATICESLNKTSNLKRTSIKESAGSKTVPVVKRQAVTESFVPRWQQLAGITTK